MSKSIEEQVYREFSEAVNSGDLEGAFKNATEDMTFRPIGTHPELGREFKGMQDILENCWMKVFQHIDENGVAITVNDIVTADGIAFRTVQRPGDRPFWYALQQRVRTCAPIPRR